MSSYLNDGELFSFDALFTCFLGMALTSISASLATNGGTKSLSTLATHVTLQKTKIHASPDH